MALLVGFALFTAVSHGAPSWPEPRSATAFADELSEVQLRSHRRSAAEPLYSNRLRRIAWADVRSRRPISERLIVDSGSTVPTSRIIAGLGIVTSLQGEPLLRVFFHPEDTAFRKRIVRDLTAQGDRIVHWGTTIGYASASRSIFVPLTDRIVMLKMSTNTVNGTHESDKRFSFDDALRSVMNSAALREYMPGEVMEEPVAVEITPNYGYIVRHFTEFHANGNLLWVPGYAFGINDFVDRDDFKIWHGRDLQGDVLRAWARLTTRANVFFEMANNHLQNLIVGLDRNAPVLRKVMFLDTNDFDQSRADVERGRQVLGLGPRVGANIQTVETLRLNTFRGARTMNLSSASDVRDRHFSEDLVGLPPERIRRLLAHLNSNEERVRLGCQPALERLDL